MLRRLLNSSIKARLFRFAIFFVVLGPLVFSLTSHIEQNFHFDRVFPHFSYKLLLLGGLNTTGAIHEGYVELREPGWEDNIDHIFHRPNLPPYDIELKLIASPREADAIRLYIGESPAGKYILSLSDTPPQQSGVYLENSNQIRKVLDLSRVARSLATQSAIALSVRCEPDLIQLNLAGKRFQFKPTKGYSQKVMILRTASPAHRTLVDSFKISRPNPDGSKEVLLGGDFQPAPLFLNTPLLLGISDSSLPFKILSFVLLSLVALLFDLTLLSLIPCRRWFHLTDRGVLLLLFPLQCVVVLCVRSIFTLHITSTALCLLLLATEKILAAMRSGFGFLEPPALLRWRLPAVVLMAATMASYLAILAITTPAPLSVTGESSLMLVAYVTPFLLFAAGALLRSQNVVAILLALVLQMPGYALLAACSPLDQRVAYFTTISAFWLMGTLIDIIKLAPWKRLLRLLVALILGALLITNAETCTRDLVNYDWIQTVWSKGEIELEDLTDFLGNQRHRKQVELVGRVHQVHKPKDVFRILCLGSSSTEGLGSSDSAKFSYPAQLEAFLHRRFASQLAKKIEVLNGGQEAMSFFGLQIFYDEVLTRLQPDLVVVYFGANGESKEAIRSFQKIKEEIRLAPFIKTEEEVWAAMRLRWNPQWLLRSYLALTHSHFFMFLTYNVERLKSSMLGERVEKTMAVPEAFTDPSRTPELIVRGAIKRGSRILLIPEVCRSLFQPQDTPKHDFLKRVALNCARYPGIFRQLAERYAGRGVYYFNMHGIFSQRNNRSYIYDEMHMRDPGYQFLAEQIGEVLHQKGLLPY